jgi:hypothetical protein
MARRILIFCLLGVFALAIGANSAATHPDGKGDEGCTPGFWKNHPDAWPISTETTLEDVFDVPDAFGLDDATLLDALSFKGGEGLAGMARNLLRQAVAGYLAALHPDVDYPRIASEVVSITNAALDSGSRARMERVKDRFDRFNNRGCPL